MNKSNCEAETSWIHFSTPRVIQFISLGPLIAFHLQISKFQIFNTIFFFFDFFLLLFLSHSIDYHSVNMIVDIRGKHSISLTIFGYNSHERNDDDGMVMKSTSLPFQMMINRLNTLHFQPPLLSYRQMSPFGPDQNWIIRFSFWFDGVAKHQWTSKSI